MRRQTRRIALVAGLGALIGLALFSRRRRRRPDEPTSPMVEVAGASRLLLTGVELFDGHKIQPGTHDVLIEGDRIAEVGPAGTIGASDAERIEGGAVVPGLVDAHVHLSFDTPENVVAGSVTAVLDLGAPEDNAFAEHPPVLYRAAGPLITAPGGYPTQSWGANGYGLEVADEDAARRAVSSLAQRGAAIIKLAVQGEPSLDARTMRAACDEAHARSLQVVAHALTPDAVLKALEAGVDALAHTPVDLLPQELIEMCGRRELAVVSTVRAFGGGDSARSNLAALARAGCRIVYGTDLGNGSIQPGADPHELKLLAEALGSHDAAWRAATTDAASFAGFPAAEIARGKPATLVVLERLGFAATRAPRRVLINGRRVV